MSDVPTHASGRQGDLPTHASGRQGDLPTHASGRQGDLPTPAVWLDERASRCPAPVIALARAAFTKPDTVVAVMVTDPAADTDIPAWCRMKGGEYLGVVPPKDGGEGRAHVVRTPPE